MRKLSIKYLVFSILGIVILIPTTLAETQSCPTQSPDPRVKNGLISTSDISGSDNKFSNTTGTCVIDSERASFISYKIPTYETLKSDYFDKSKPPTIKVILEGNKDQSAIQLPAGNNRVYYIHNGSLTLNSNITVSTTGVIFVDGDLTINTNLTHSGNVGLVFVVKGNMIIAPSVTQIDAVLISSGTIFTAGSECNTSAVTASQLVINGSLISLDVNKPIRFCRKLAGIGNNTAAAEVINQQAKYLVILKDVFSDTLQTWSELP